MVPNTELDKQIEEISILLSEKKIKSAINLLSRIDIENIPREKRCLVAKLCQKAGLSASGIRSLAPLVSNKSITPEEWVQYAACLNDLGAAREVIERLKDSNIHWPIARDLELAKSHISLWEVEKAIPLLEKVKDQGQLSKEGARLLSFCYRFSGEFEKSIAVLEEDEGFADERKLGQFLIEAFNEKKEGGLTFLRSLREKAVQKRQDEFTRELDFYIAFVAHDQALIEKLYFGTSSEGFRNRVRQASKTELVIPDDYYLGSVSSMALGKVFDLFKGVEVANPNVRLKVGQVLHRLLVALVGDFYCGLSVARLHELVFQGETFNSETSPSRIHQIVKRLKGWMSENMLPLSIEEQGGNYKLKVKEGYAIKISKKHLSLPQESPLYVRLELALPGKDFSIKEAAHALGLSRRFARKILERGESEGWIQMKGRGRTTRYEFFRKTQSV